MMSVIGESRFPEFCPHGYQRANFVNCGECPYPMPDVEQFESRNIRRRLLRGLANTWVLRERDTMTDAEIIARVKKELGGDS